MLVVENVLALPDKMFDVGGHPRFVGTMECHGFCREVVVYFGLQGVIKRITFLGSTCLSMNFWPVMIHNPNSKHSDV